MNIINRFLLVLVLVVVLRSVVMFRYIAVVVRVIDNREVICIYFCSAVEYVVYTSCVYIS